MTFNKIVEKLHEVNEELPKIVENFDPTALDICRLSVAIPSKPAYTDSINRRLEVFKSAIEFVEAAFGRVDLFTIPAANALLFGKEIADIIIDRDQEPELIGHTEGAMKETEYAYHKSICLPSVRLNDKAIMASLLRMPSAHLNHFVNGKY